MGERRIKVVHAPFDVGGNSYHLARAERRLGCDSKTLVYFSQWFGFPNDRNLKMKPGANPLLTLRWWFAMLRVALTADVVHFNFGGSFLNNVTRGWVLPDVPLLRRLGIATFVTFQGCDSRLSSYCRTSFPINGCEKCPSREFCESTYDAFRRAVIAKAQGCFDGIFALNPDLMHNIPRSRFLPYSNCDLEEWRPPAAFDPHHAGPVRIVHAPTWRELKGTDGIIDAIEELKEEGENVELILVENVPHEKVRELYETADLLVDQILIGWYGGLAVELMALGKPVVAYVREQDTKFLPAEMRKELPIVPAHAGTLKEVLRDLVRDPEGRQLLGERSRAFAQRWHHPCAVARVTTDAYREALERREPLGLLRRFRTVGRLGFGFARQIGRLYLDYFGFVTLLKGFTFQRLPRVYLRLVLIILGPMIRLRSWLRLRVLGRPASVWGTTPILTIDLLARADRLLGLRGKSAAYAVYRISSRFDYVFQKHINFVARHAQTLLPTLYRTLFLWSLTRFDVFHLFYDQGFLERQGRFGVNLEELETMRRLGKRVYLYAYGADVRTRKATEALGRYNCCLHCDRVMVNCICDDEENTRKQQQYRATATALVSMGDMMAYVPGARNLHYWPIDVERIPYVGVAWDGRRPLRIFHAPNHMWAKGSRYLREAVGKLRAAGHSIELKEVSGVSNEVVLREMSAADIVADQFLIGWHGYTALEALAQGKVVLCYIRDRSMLLAPEECPIVSANPDTLERVLVSLSQSPPEALTDAGKAGRRYVERHFSVPAMATRLATLYAETAGFTPRVDIRIAKAADALRRDLPGRFAMTNEVAF